MPEHYDPEMDATEDFDPNAKVTIKVAKGNGKSDTLIKGSINGMSYEVAVDQEVEVPAAVASALSDTGVPFEVVDGEGAGLPSPSTAPLTDTATRLEPAIKPDDAIGTANGDAPIPTLEGGEGDTGTGAGSAEPTAESPENVDAQRNAENQGVASTNADNSQGDGAGANPASQTAADGNKSDADEEGEEGEKPETVDQLKERIATINDLDALKAEHDAEENGRKRTTALAAIHARIDEVQAKQ